MKLRAPSWAAAFGFLLVVTACTSGESGSTTTTSLGRVDTSTTSSAAPKAPTSTTSTMAIDPPPPLPTTTTTTLAPPLLPNAFDLAVAALRDIEGFRYVDDDLPTRQLDELEMRIGSLYGDVLADYSWSQLRSEGDSTVVAVSLYPSAPFRADPELDFGIALAASDFDDPSRTPIGDFTGWRIDVDGEPWTFVGDDTHVFLVIGDPDIAEKALELLLAANGPSHLWQEGECLYFGDGAVPYAPFGEGEIVPCDGAHTHEVIWSTVLKAGPDARFPDGDLSDQSFERCEVAYEGFMGSPEFPSDVTMIRYLPDVMEWEEGDRYLACVVYLGDRSGDPIALADTLRGRGQEFLRETPPGQCTDLAGGPGVRCSRPHTFEYLGTADLGLDGAEYPGATAASNAADEVCEEALASYASSVRDGDVGLEAFAVWYPGPAAWERGDRFAHCVGWALDDDGDLQLLMGSIAEEWSSVRPPRGGGLDA